MMEPALLAAIEPPLTARPPLALSVALPAPLPMVNWPSVTVVGPVTLRLLPSTKALVPPTESDWPRVPLLLMVPRLAPVTVTALLWIVLPSRISVLPLETVVGPE